MADKLEELTEKRLRFAAALRKARLALGLDRKELASKARIKPNTLAVWELGRQRPRHFRTMVTLCNALRLPKGSEERIQLFWLAGEWVEEESDLAFLKSMLSVHSWGLEAGSSQQVTAGKESRERRFEEEARAWENVSTRDMYDLVLRYYEDPEHHVPLFEYPGVPGKFPLYAQELWRKSPSQDTLRMIRPACDEPPRLTEAQAERESDYHGSDDQEEFLEFFKWFKREHQRVPIFFNGTPFRLTDLQSTPTDVTLTFGKYGHFFDTIKCQFFLEHEVRRALLQHSHAGSHPRLPARDQMAGDEDAILKFCQRYPTRIGISNLLLLKSGRDKYVPMVQKRGYVKLEDGLSIIPSGIFDVSTAPTEDFELEHQFLVEAFEEMYKGTAVESRLKENLPFEPRWFYNRPGVRELVPPTHTEFLPPGADSTVTFEVTGLMIDLLRIVPEITTVVVVPDETYYEQHTRSDSDQSRIDLSGEFTVGAHFEIRGDIADLDELERYLHTEMPRRHGSKEVGFDPSLWTLCGGFCFYQGIKRAVVKKLLV